MNKYLSLFVLFLFSNIIFAQVGIGTESPNATLEIVGNSSVTNIPDGVIVPKLTLTALKQKSSAYTHHQNGALIYITGVETNNSDVKTSSITSTGFYYYNQPTEQSPGVWVNMNPQITVNKRSFYLPSIVLPINEIATDYVSYDEDTETYEVDLYEVVLDQFSPTLYNSNGSTNSFVNDIKQRNMYEYHILYADDVFTNLEFVQGNNNIGVLKYKVNTSIIVKNPPFMNIILKEK